MAGKPQSGSKRSKSKALDKKRKTKHAKHRIVLIEGKRLPPSRTGVVPMTQREKDGLLDRALADPDFRMPWLGPGRPPQFETPSELWRAFTEYVQWCQANPWYKAEWKDHKLQQIPLGRPYTWDSFGVRMGISSNYFDTFKRDLKKDDPLTGEFLGVLETIDKCIRSQKFEGAMVGAFNATMAAYDLGYKKDITNVFGGGTGMTIKLNEQSDMDLLNDVKRQLEEIDNPTPTRTEGKTE